MVAGPGRDDDHGNPAAGGHLRDQRLRAVAAGHADHVRPTRHRPLGELHQVVTRTQLDRLDAPRPACFCEPESGCLSAAAARVDDQNAPGSRRDRISRRSGPPEPAGIDASGDGDQRDSRGEQPDAHQNRPETLGRIRSEGHQQVPHRRGRTDQDSDHPIPTATGHREPGTDDSDRQQGQLHGHPPDIADQRQHRDRPDNNNTGHNGQRRQPVPDRYSAGAHRRGRGRRARRPAGRRANAHPTASPRVAPTIAPTMTSPG